MEPSDILVIVPNWVRWSACHYRVYKDPNRCLRCNRCPMTDILALRDRMGFKLIVIKDDVAPTDAIAHLSPKAVVIVGSFTGHVDIPVDVVPAERSPDPLIDTVLEVPEIEGAVDRLLAGEN